MRLKLLAELLQGTYEGPDLEFTGFALDHREVNPGDVFVAVKGERVDGNDFIDQALDRGAVASVGDRGIVVQDLVAALAHFGNTLRHQFDGPVIGITGSNGKTSTKEMLSAALQHTLKSPGNRNTELTSPLVWFDRKPSDRFAVIEMSMRGLRQIAHLCAVHEPNHGIITMIGTAHIEKVGGADGVAQAKAELLEALPASGIAVIPGDSEFAEFLRAKTCAQVKTFGENPGNDCQLLGYRALSLTESEARIRIGEHALTVRVPSIGKHQAMNACAALLMATELGLDPTMAAENLSHAELPPMRMEIVDLNGATVLLDTYNASPDSMQAALCTLMELPCEGRRYAVIGEMKELGDFTETGHRQVGEFIAESRPESVLLYGPDTGRVEEAALQGGYPATFIQHASSLDDVSSFLSHLNSGDLVLIKGSRALGLEQALKK